MIEKEKPNKIITNGTSNLTAYSYATGRLMKKLANEGKIKCPIYTFDKTIALKLTKRSQPKLIVNITSTFDTKIEAIQAHKSQISRHAGLEIILKLKARLNGWKNRFKYAEVFDRIN